MNKLEFDTIMNIVGIKKIPTVTLDCCGKETDTYIFNDIYFYFSGIDYTVAEGKIPLVVAKAICEKYPTNQYAIRVNGGCRDRKPTNWCSGNHDEFYLGTYQIDTKEGLIILLTELANYFQNMQQLNAKSIDMKFNNLTELVAQSNDMLIKTVNPYKSTQEWLTEKNLPRINNMDLTVHDKEIRVLLDKYDETINPFINGSDNMTPTAEYSNKVRLELGGNGNNARISICNLQTGEVVTYIRDNNCLYYKYFYRKDGRDNDFNHYFSVQEGEVIEIWHQDGMDLSYNLTKGIAGPTNEEKTPITIEQKEAIILELKRAIIKTECITIKNMYTPRALDGVKKL